MGLQIRLRHALGERVLDLPARSVEQPVIVGRGGDADVQIPSIGVGQHHLALFVHEGHWIVQDAPGGTGTLVNGVQLAGPRVLRGGEVLSLGSDANAPTIEIDGTGIAAAAEHQAVSGMIGADESIFAAHRAAPPADHYAPPPLFPARMPPVESAYEAESNGDEVAWTAEASAPRSYYVPKRRKSSDAAVAFAVVTIIAILVGAGLYVYIHKQQQAQVIVAPKAAAPATLPTTVRSKPAVGPSIFTPQQSPAKDRGEESTANRPPVRSESRPATKPVKDVAEAAPIEEPAPHSAEMEKAFKRVENAYDNPDPPKALLAFDAFEQEFPGVQKAKIEQYRQDILDKIWWERIDSLFEKRKALLTGIKKTERDIKAETEAAYRKTVLEPRLEDQKLRVEAIGERLSKEMSYRLATPPPIGQDMEMRQLREKRDRTVYDTWKRQFLKYIRSNHGVYPWANEK